MNVWLFLFLALGVLWLQALVLQLSALRALLEALHTRWEAMLGLERLRVRRLLEWAGELPHATAVSLKNTEKLLEPGLRLGDPAALETLRAAVQAVDAAAPALEAVLRGEALRLGVPAHAQTLLFRCRNAEGAFYAALKEYETRRCALRMERLVAWFGHGPYSAVGMAPIVR